MSEVQEYKGGLVDETLAKELEQKRDVIKRTVAKGATDDELEMFMHLAKQYNLDPFQSEIYFWKFGKKDPTIMTSRDGYLKIANQNPNFDGLDSGAIYPGDKFSKSSDGGVNHELSIENMGKQPIGGYAVVYRKDRSMPIRVIVPFKDYNKGNKVWKNYPSAMIQKVAESMALKRAFSVSGLVSKEEMGYENNKPPQNLKQVENKKSERKKGIEIRKKREKIINEMSDLVQDDNNSLTGEDIKSMSEQMFNNEDVGGLNLDQLQKLKQAFAQEEEVETVEAELVDDKLSDEEFGKEMDKVVS